MLLGRSAELGQIDVLLADARSGRSRAIALRGEVGIGKTALCEYTSRAARDEGMVALETSGVETESELPFAALGELLAEILPRSAEIPDRQAAVLASALGVG